MSVSLAALFAAALYQVRAADADPDSMDEAVMLLGRAADDRSVSFSVVDGNLFVNDIPLAADAPGVSLVIKVLDDHGMMRLALPAGIEPRRWREVAEIFASVAALYPTPDDVRDALRASVPAAVVVSRQDESGITDLREEMFVELPGLMTDAGAITLPPTEGLTSRSADRSELSARLDPILKEAVEAVDARDFERLASLLLEIAAIGEHSDEATRAILARERRRVTPQSFVEAMVRLLPRLDASPLISRAVMTLGRDGVDALIDALSGSVNAVERRAYMELLTASNDAGEAILASLGSAQAELVRDMAEVAGRRRMDAAIPTLGHLLKDNDEGVRTTAWQALEQIGTNEALAVLYGGPGAGRSR